MCPELKRRDSMASEIYRQCEHAVRHMITHREFLDRLSKIWSGGAYKKLRRYDRERMNGILDHFNRTINYGVYGQKSMLVFCYDCNGRRYAIDPKSYKRIKPINIYQRATWCGFCWRADLSKIHSGEPMVNGRTVKC